MGKVRFGDVVKEVKVNIDRSHNPYEFYVAGDHMDSEDLTIRRKGRFATDDVGPAFIRLFKPGQVLYGSRRTYLKKIAVADFEGITANTTFVLETKDENVFLQKLLPFLMLSDSFTEWSVKKSKGSTNPYVLFSDLADYKFNLPPLEEQRKLADLLWSAYDLKESYKRLLAVSDELAKSRFVEMFENGQYPTETIKSICKIVTDGTHQPPRFVDTGIPFLFVSNIVDNALTYETSKFISKKDYTELIKRTPVELGDLLLSIVGSYGNPAIVRSTKPFCFQRHLAYLKPNRASVVPEYLHAAFLSSNVKEQIERRVKGIAQKTLNLSELKSIEIPLPPISLQTEFAAFIEQLDKSKATLQKSIDRLDSVMKNLLNTSIAKETT